MNPLIPMGFETPDFAGAYARGAQVYQQRQEATRQNALREAMSQYGPAAMQGDQNALRELAKYDPELGMGLMQNQQQMDLRNREDARQQQELGLRTQQVQQGMSIDNERLAMAKEQARQQAQVHAAQMSAVEREQTAAEVGKFAQTAQMAWNQGPEAFQGFMGQYAEQLPEEFRGMSYEDAPYAIGMATGLVEGFGGTAPEPTAEMRNLEFRATQAGLQPGSPEWQQFMAQGGAPKGTTLSVGPDGSVQFRDGPLGVGGQTEQQAEQKAVTTEMIGDTANRAREEAGSFGSTGFLGSLAQNIQGTNAADLVRHVDALKSQATVGQLKAMRESSPTGSAGLGPLTDRDAQMLAAQAGALDPRSRDFARDLDAYERNLLRTIHGRDEGDRIFEQSRGASQEGGPKPITSVDEYNALPSGSQYIDPNGNKRTKR